MYPGPGQLHNCCVIITVVLLYLFADEGQLKAGKISLATETFQIIPSVNVLSVDFEVVSQKPPVVVVLQSFTRREILF